MEELRLQGLAEKVVEWHNRHPLARRITSLQVQSVGYVLLPFVPAVQTDRNGRAAPPLPAWAAGARQDPVLDDLPLEPEAHPEPGRPGGDDSDGDGDVSGDVTGDDGGAHRPSLRERALARSNGQELPSLDDVVSSLNPANPASQVPTDSSLPNSALKAAFSEDFYEHAAPAKVARWAQRHGQQLRQRLGPGELRQVLSDPALLNASQPTAIVLRTALIAVQGRRARLLLGAGEPAAVLGKRLWSLPRVAACLTGLTLCGLLAANLWLLSSQTAPASAAGPAVAALGAAPGPMADGAAPAPAAAASPAALAASAQPSFAAAVASAVAVSVAGSGAMDGAAAAAASAVVGSAAARAAPPAASSAAGAAGPASAPMVALASPAAGQRPVDVEPQLGQIRLPSLGDFYDHPAVAAARAKRLEMQKRSGGTPGLETGPSTGPSTGPVTDPATNPATTPATVPAPGPAPATAAVAGSSAASATSASAVRSAVVGAQVRVPGQSAFALSTRVLRTAAESEQFTAAMRALLLSTGVQDVHVEALAVGADWRVVGWPFASREAADRARALLVSRGLRVEVVDF